MITAAKIIGVGVDSDAYHTQEAQRGSPEFVMSSSSLRAFAQCPARWKAGYTPPDTEAKSFGNLLDTLALTPESFDSKYAIKPPSYTDSKGVEKDWNGNSKTCKAWIAGKKSEGLKPISADEFVAAHLGAKHLHADDTIKRFIDASDKQVHVAAIWQDENGVSVPIQCLIDLAPRLVSEFRSCVGDLKSTRNAAAAAYRRWCFTAGYHIQLAFNLDMLSAAEGGSDRNTACFILVENYPPWQTGKRILSQDFTQFGRKQYRLMLSNYAACLKSGKWPGYDDNDESVQGWGIVEAEPWMESQSMFEEKFAFGEETLLEDDEPTEAETPVDENELIP